MLSSVTHFKYLYYKYIQGKSERVKNLYHINMNHKREKQKHYVIKRIHQGTITIPNVISEIAELKNPWNEMTKLKKEKDICTIIIEDFKTPLLVIENISSEKISRNIDNL